MTAILSLIPPPVTCDEGPVHFAPREGLNIVVSHAAQPGERVAARSLQAALQRRDLSVPIQP